MIHLLIDSLHRARLDINSVVCSGFLIEHTLFKDVSMSTMLALILIDFLLDYRLFSLGISTTQDHCVFYCDFLKFDFWFLIFFCFKLCFHSTNWPLNFDILFFFLYFFVNFCDSKMWFSIFFSLFFFCKKKFFFATFL